MIVCKFGGTSVGNVETAKKIKEIVFENKNRKIFVVSALGKNKQNEYKITDKLFSLYYSILDGGNYLEIIDKIFKRYEDMSRALNVVVNWSEEKNELINLIECGKITKEYIVSRGEFYSAKLYAKYLGCEFLDAKDYIKFKKSGEISVKNTKNALNKLNFGKNYVIGGYYGSNNKGNICIFDRGGSDITGAIICKALDFEIYENYTDVDGVFNRNPNLFIGASNMPLLSFKTAIKMAECGNEVVHRNALNIIKNSNSILIVKDTKNYKKLGTIILDNYQKNKNNLYICVSKVLVFVFNYLDLTELNKLYDCMDLLKIIKLNNKTYVYAKSIYVSQESVMKVKGCLNSFDGYILTFFSDDKIMSSKHRKLIKKINNKTKNDVCFSYFCSKHNNFDIVCRQDAFDNVVRKINIVSVGK